MDHLFTQQDWFDRLLVEATPEGVHLAAMFEQPLEIEAAIQKIDLLKNTLFLEKTGGKVQNGREG